MASGLLFDDTISFAPVGSGLPPGFSSFPTGSGISASIRAGSDGGCFEVHNWLEFLTGQFLSCALSAHGHLQDVVNIWFGWKSEGFSLKGPILEMWSFPSIFLNPSGNPFKSVIFQIEGDGTLSAVVAGSPNIIFWNSGSLGGTVGPFVMQPQVWYFFEVGIKFKYGDGGLFQPEVSIIVDGEVLTSSAQGTSNFYSSASFAGATGPPEDAPGDSGILFFTFSNPNGSGRIGLADVAVDDSFNSIPAYTFALWNFIIDNHGTDYGPAAPIISITTPGGNSTAEFTATLDVPMPGLNGPVLSLHPITLGKDYTLIDVPILITATPAGTPNGSGFAAHGVPMPVSNRKESQAVTEYAYNQLNPFIRIPQTPLELGFKDPAVGIRIAQAVIELPPASVQPSLGGWIVKEI